MSGSEINGLRAGDELSEISVPGPTPVRERFVDNPGEGQMHQLDADLLPHLAAEPSVRRLSGLQQATGREPQFPRGGSPNADQNGVRPFRRKKGSSDGTVRVRRTIGTRPNFAKASAIRSLHSPGHTEASNAGKVI